MMNNQQAFEYIQEYFHELFHNRNVGVLDAYLDPDYFDDDIGNPASNHIKNSKDFLTNLFSRKPTISVDVLDVMTQDNVITAFLAWYEDDNHNKRLIRKGVAIFVMKGEKILKRHTYVYFEKE